MIISLIKKINRKIQTTYVSCFSSQIRWKKIYKRMAFYKDIKIYILAEIYREKLIRYYGIFLGLNTVIGKNLNFPHPINIVIGDGVIIGDNVTVYQGVTIGVYKTKRDGTNNSGYPYIGNNVKIYTGAIILGNIKIGDNTIIGANSVVTKDIPSNSIYMERGEYILKGNNNEI